MSNLKIDTIESAPEASKPILRNIEKAFGSVSNVAGAMASSSVLLAAFVDVFSRVHGGTFTEREIATLLLTNAVTNKSSYPVAFYTAVALKEGVPPADVAAIRQGTLPSDPHLAALSRFTRALIEGHGSVDGRELEAVLQAGLRSDQVLEVVLVVAEFTMTNYTASITQPPLEAALEPHRWQG